MFFRFASPLFLVLLLLLPLLERLRRQRDRGFALKTPQLAVTPETTLASRIHRLLPWLRVLVLALLLVALARPQWGRHERNVLTEGVNIALAVDLSQSMAALDFVVKENRVTRLDAVRHVLTDFIPKRTNDRIALIAFGSQAYTQVPLTSDTELLLKVLGRLEIGAAGTNTAIGDALGISLKRLKDAGGKSNVIVLLTDGQSNTGELPPEAATRMAKEMGVRVYTIGVGTRGKAPYVVDDPFFGRQVIYRDVDIDDKALERIAGETGGLYFRATDTEGLEKIYATIDELEKVKIEIKEYDASHDLYLWLLVPAFCLFLIERTLLATRFVRVP